MLPIPIIVIFSQIKINLGYNSFFSRMYVTTNQTNRLTPKKKRYLVTFMKLLLAFMSTLTLSPPTHIVIFSQIKKDLGEHLFLF